ncbi:Aspartyl protease [Flavobacterium branchiophilum]
MFQTVLQMERNNDVYPIPCKVNGIPLNFMFNMGSTDVSISLTEASFMIRMDFLKMKISDYSVANGTSAKGTKLNITEIELGGL